MLSSFLGVWRWSLKRRTCSASRPAQQASLSGSSCTLAGVREHGVVHVEAPEDAPASETVLSSVDILENILGYLAHPQDGLDVRDWTKYALVCRTWRKAMEEVPIVFRATKPLTQKQAKKLITDPPALGALHFCYGEVSAWNIMNSQAFAERNARHLRYLWDVLIEEPGKEHSCNFLAPYNNLHTVYVTPRRTAMLQNQNAQRKLQLDATALAKKPLRAFSVHGYDYMDLRSLPPRLPVLNVDNAQLLGSEEGEVEWGPDMRFGRVQVGGGRASMLAHSLAQYGTVCNHLQLLARILVVPGRKEDAQANVVLPIRHAAECGLRDISIEFDEVLLIGEENQVVSSLGALDFVNYMASCEGHFHYVLDCGRMHVHKVTIVLSKPDGSMAVQPEIAQIQVLESSVESAADASNKAAAWWAWSLRRMQQQG
ncbi:hypothetical protein WJX74_002493 [Apatococcus lobatus]|uniref:F-box domain-containing protein n=1 Tax=Apatococcus lobatus TaxID=904363 RepID=A0AAW1Q988_9CHLO